jgi:hypothetical protein
MPITQKGLVPSRPKSVTDSRKGGLLLSVSCVYFLAPGAFASAGLPEHQAAACTLDAIA